MFYSLIVMSAGIDLNVYLALVVFLVPFLILAINWCLEFFGLKSNSRRREEALQNFNNVVQNLSSDNPAAQLSAAVLLRRYFTLTIGGKKYLHAETVNVISSILRTATTGVYQKTLADGLAYGEDLSNTDLQRTNLQNVYLGTKKESPKQGTEDSETKRNRVILDNADMFMANLTYALISNVSARGIVLYNAILHGASIKFSDFSYADFRGADLTNASFEEVLLCNADFRKAINIPAEIRAGLKEGIYTGREAVSTKKASGANAMIFFSMPGAMSKEDETMVRAYRQYLIELGFDVVYYNRDTYPRFGQLSHIKSSVEKSVAMIAFGTKQTFIKDGVYRPGMRDEHVIKDSWVSTPWNEVEVGMAAMAGLPILLVKDDDIADGIFDSIISEAYVYVMSSKTDVKELGRTQSFTEWLSRFR